MQMRPAQATFPTLLILLVPLLATAQEVSYDDVMLLVNDRSWASTEIAADFAARRNIPAWHICHIDADTAETIDSADFVPLQWKIQEWMRSRDLADSINYIVTTKGCPLRVRTAFPPEAENYAYGQYYGQSSFEDCLALINGVDSSYILTTKFNGRIQSPYFMAWQSFQRSPFVMPIYLITRLDAYTVEEVKRMIRSAESTASASDGVWVFDIAPEWDGTVGGKGLNDGMRSAAALLGERGLNVVLNEDAAYLHDQRNVLGYVSFGSNDEHSGGGLAARPRFTWLAGAIGHTFVSTSGRSFYSASYGQSLVADLIAEGASAVVGYTDEPYSSPMARPEVLFDRYTSGRYNMAESFFGAIPYIAWRQVVIGDPKMRLAEKSSAVEEERDERGSAIISAAPNPFRSSSVIRYRVPAPGGWVRLDAYDELGRCVAVLRDGAEAAGERSAILDAGALPAGPYLVRLAVTAGDRTIGATTVVLLRGR